MCQFAIIALLLFTAISLHVDSGQSKTLVVDDDTGRWADHNSIKDAVSQTEDGDLVLVYSGNYDERFSILEEIEIRGNGTDEVNLTDTAYHSYSKIIEIESPGVKITGIRMFGHEDDDGIFVQSDGMGTHIADCNVSGFSTGIYFDSANNIVDECIIDNNIQGIKAYGEGTIIEDSDFILNSGGVRIRSDQVSVVRCTFNNNTVGISMVARDNMIEDCVFNDDGITISEYLYGNHQELSIDNCTINRKPIVLIKDMDGRDYSTDAGQYIIVNSSNLTISGMNAGGSFGSIYSVYSDNLTIRDSNIQDVYYGILIYGTSNYSTIRNVTVKNASRTGFDLRGYGSQYDLIADSSATRCNVGFEIEGENYTLVNCSVQDSDLGFILSGKYNYVYNSSATNNTYYGIKLNGNYVLITGCNISHNQRSGIFTDRSDYNRIIKNDLAMNGEYGVDLDGRLDYPPVMNLINLNNFYRNGNGSWPQGNSDKDENMWNNSRYGNYWSDYNGPDDDEDGVGDTAYQIDGSDVEDHYPLMEPTDGYSKWNWWRSVSDEWIIVDDCDGRWVHFQSIQDAIDASEYGDLIRVYAGTYNESLEIEESGRKLIGNGSVTTVIDGDGEDVITNDGYSWTIKGLGLTGGGYGIKCTSNSNLISDCRVYDNSGSGVYITPTIRLGEEPWMPWGWEGGSYNKLVDLVVEDNGGEGIVISSDGYENIVSRCIVMNNSRYGIYISSYEGEDESNHRMEDNDVLNCTVYSNSKAGIYFGHVTSSGVVDGCLVFDNGEHGILLRNATENIITNCTVYSNIQNGIYLAVDAVDNVIHHNEFFGNNDDGEQAYCSEDNNTWDDGEEGNFWSDYDGMDSDHDNIGDSPHAIKGSEAQDRYPLMLGGTHPGQRPVAFIDEIRVNDTIVDLYGHGNDTDGEIVEYEWSSSIDGELYNGVPSSPLRFNLSEGNHSISFRVQDDDQFWSEYVVENVSICNIPPENISPNATIVEIAPSPSTEGERVNFTGNATDPDGNVTTHVWNSSMDGEFYNGSSNSTSFAGLSRGNHTISYRVMDDNGTWSEWSLENLIVKRAKGNVAPQASIIKIDPAEAMESCNVSFIGNGTDVDGYIVSYVWTSSVDGEFYNGTSNSTILANMSIGNHIIAFRVYDNNGTWSEVNATLKISKDDEDPPEATISGISPSPALKGVGISFKANGTAVNGTIIWYVWRSSIDGEFYNGTSSSIVISTLSGGSHAINLSVFDSEGRWSQEVSSSLFVNTLPEVEHLQLNNTVVSGVAVISGTSSDNEGNISYVEIRIGDGEWGRAAGITTWTYEWNTTNYDDGAYTISIRSFDGHNHSDIKTIQMTVDNGERVSHGEGSRTNNDPVIVLLIIIAGFMTFMVLFRLIKRI